MSTDQESKDTRTRQDSQQSKPKRSRKGAGGLPTEQHPERVRKAISTLVANVGSQLGAANLLGLPKSTVRDMVTRCAGELGTAKKELAGKALALSELCVDRVSERVDDLSAFQQAVVGGIYADKACKLTETSQPIAIQVNVLGQAVRSLQELTSSADTVLDALPDEVPQSQVVSDPAK